MTIELLSTIFVATFGFIGIVGLFMLKSLEIRQDKVYFAALREKCDAVVFKVIVKSGQKISTWRSWHLPIVFILSHMQAFAHSAYVATNRLIQNKPMRLTGVAHSKGYYATERVSKYLREVSKGMERDTVSPAKTIED